MKGNDYTATLKYIEDFFTEEEEKDERKQQQDSQQKKEESKHKMKRPSELSGPNRQEEN